MKNIKNKIELLEHIEASGVDFEEFQNNLRLYSDVPKMTIKTAQVELAEFAASAGTSIKEYAEQYFFIEANSDEEALKLYSEVRIQDENKQLTMSGIEAAWSERSINQGKPNLIVSRVNQINPYDETQANGCINIGTIIKEELKSKIEYAVSENPNSPSVLVAAEGAHWTALAIDPSKQLYRYLDSFRTKDNEDSMPKHLKQLLGEVLPNYKELDIRTLKAQQTDGVSCGYYVLRNAQSIAQEGIGAVLNYEVTPEAREAEKSRLVSSGRTKVRDEEVDDNVRQAEIDHLALQVQAKLVNKVIEKMQYAQHRQAFRDVMQNVSMISGTKLKEISPLSTAPERKIFKSKEIRGRS